MSTPIEILKFYNSKTWKQVRNYIRQRDHGICQKCGGVGEEVHHIEPLTLKNYQTSIAIDPNNLVLLCKSCHMSERGSEAVRNDVMFDEYGRLIPRKENKYNQKN